MRQSRHTHPTNLLRLFNRYPPARVIHGTGTGPREPGQPVPGLHLIPTLSAAENVEAALVPQRVPPADMRTRAALALDSVGLADRAHHLPSELSGGQQERVGIARALVKQPKVLLADEPTGNLNVDTRDEIMLLLESLWRERGLTLVLVTHDAAIAGRAQRVAAMKDGRLSIAFAPEEH